MLKKKYAASLFPTPPLIDGVLNDECWRTCRSATGFSQAEPNAGMPPAYETNVFIGYDNNAVYIGAKMYDSQPDSIVRILTKRDDDFDFADFFGIAFDTYLDGQNAFAFFVTAAGVQNDLKFTPDGEDETWNAVWESKTAFNDSGWAAELKIPFSALRFSNEKMQSWGMNIARSIRRIREMSVWNPVDPEIDGIVNQFGILENLTGITPPLRLSLYPYISTYLKNYEKKNTFLFNAGADLKYGLSEAFTLDATLIPDFGQVRSDDVVLNLSPFEVEYEEQRQFFTESTELFSKGEIFYSRRIGGVPVLYEDAEDMVKPGEIFIENPVSAPLYNATKISGRTKNKLGIGWFNATSGETYAVFKDTGSGQTRKVLTQPLANYNFLVLDQALKNNSFIALINSTVLRNGNFYDANVSGTTMKILNEENSYAIDGTVLVSQKFFPDSSIPGLRTTTSGPSANEAGHHINFSASKVKGNFTAESGYYIIGDTYDHNDMGYLENNNEAGLYSTFKYNIYTPFWKINKLFNTAGFEYKRLYNPSAFTGIFLYFNCFTVLKNFHAAGMNFNFSPLPEYDFYEPRMPGRFYLSPPWYSPSIFISSDYRKKFAVDLSYYHSFTNQKQRVSDGYNIEPRFRFGTKFLMIYQYNYNRSLKDEGYAGISNDTIFFGQRNVNTHTNKLNVSYIFTRAMSLTFRMRHYWSSADYFNYFILQNDGALAASDYSGNADINFTAFNIDLVFTWQFSPGSEVSVVWKNAIIDYNSRLNRSLGENINDTFGYPKLNSVSVRVLYFIDYQPED